MSFAKLVCTCQCGGPIQPLRVFITSNHCLDIEGKCLKCGEMSDTVFKLAYLYKNCPKDGKPQPLQPPLALPAPAPAKAEFTPEDTIEAHGFGVSFPEPP